MRNLLCKTFGLLALFIFMACGGGGSSTPPPPPQTYTVSTVAAEGSSFAPTSATVVAGNTTTFTVLALTGYTNLAVTGGNGTLVVNTYTTGPVYANTTLVSTVTKVVPASYSISGTVSGATQAGVTMTMTPENVTVLTAANGTYTFTGLYNGLHTITPSYPGETFSPTSKDVMVAGTNVSGIDFLGTVKPPVLTTGKLVYASGDSSLRGIYSMDLATGTTSLVWGTSGNTPDAVLSTRTNSISFRVPGTVYPADGIWSLNFSPRFLTYAVPVQGIIVNGYASTTVGSYDVGTDPVYGGIAAVTLQNKQGGTDIFLVAMNGSLFWSPVTTNVQGLGSGNNSSPVITESNSVTGEVSVLYIKNGTEIWKQVANVRTDTPPAATLFVSNVFDSARPMSVNAAYTHLAFMKNVAGVSHITIIPLAGGAEVDLGVGSDPSWTLDGSNKILYTVGGALWVINPDGTGKVQVPLPTNPAPLSLSGVVFGPAGF